MLLFADSAQFEARYREGLSALGRNDTPAALESLKAASQLQPENPRAWLALAEAYRRAADGEHTREATRKAIETARNALEAENRADLRHLLGKALESEGDRAAGIIELEKAVRLNPYEESYHFDLAQAQLQNRKFDAAIRTLEASRKTFARSPQLELALGVAYYGQRRFDEAVDSFLRTIAMAPDIEQPYVFLARMMDQAGDRLGAIAEKFRAYAGANPRSYLGYYLHAKALIARSENPPLAEKLLRQAIALEDAHFEPHFELGGLLEQRRQWADAAPEFARCAELNPKDPAPHYRLARIYDRLGKPDEARRERTLHAELNTQEMAAMDSQIAATK
jgi:tetratricopeptide (TPR) repeat protein